MYNKTILLRICNLINKLLVKGGTMKKFLKFVILFFYSIIQLTILILGFFACTSIIKILPWYEPLTMGAFFVLMYIFPIQVFISIILHFFNRKTLNKISNNTIGIIALILLTIGSNTILLAIVCSIIDIILIVKFIIAAIKEFIKIKVYV